MLVLTRQIGGSIILKTNEGDVWITLLEIRDRTGIRLGIEAPKSIGIYREELLADQERAELAAELDELKNGKKSAF